MITALGKSAYQNKHSLEEKKLTALTSGFT